MTRSRVSTTDADGVKAAAEVVRAGGVLLYPTETVYGLGGDPSRRDVVEAVYRLKGREANKPMLVLTDEWVRVAHWLLDITDVHRRLMQHAPAWPVTLLFTATAEAPRWLIGPEGLVGVRRTSDAFCRAVIAEAACPLLSTSANEAGGPNPVRFEDVPSEIRARVDLGVDAGAPLAGLPSTVVCVEAGRLVVLREGAVAEETLRAAIGD